MLLFKKKRKKEKKSELGSRTRNPKQLITNVLLVHQSVKETEEIKTKLYWEDKCFNVYGRGKTS